MLTFSLPEREEHKIENSEGPVIKPSDLTDKLMEEQLPEVFKQNGGSSINKNEDNNSDSNGSDSDNDAPSIGILEEIKENGDGPLSKILSAIPDINLLRTIFISVLTLFTVIILI